MVRRSEALTAPLLGVLLACAALDAGCSCKRAASPAPSASAPSEPDPPRLNGHLVRLDEGGKLLSWSIEPSPFDHVVRLAWGALETKFPVQSNGKETFFAYSRFDPSTFEGVAWPHNPASLNAMLADSALAYYAYSGDTRAVHLVRGLLDHQIAHGSTPAGWKWARVPYASGAAGDLRYDGADDAWCDGCGRGDGKGVLEPDKVGELGFAYIRFYELTGEPRYRDAALACANVLAANVRQGDAARSPWPFRVYARTGVVREQYSAHVLSAVRLFDELARLGIGRVADYRRARAIAWSWMMTYPMQNDAWSGYFEDIHAHDDPTTNPNQLLALEAAQYILSFPEDDPEWRKHAAHLVEWVVDTFGGDENNEPGLQYGARAISEQRADMAKMGSHTARFAATQALWYEKTGDEAAKAEAFRAFNWATYMCDEDGVVAVGEDKNEGFWFSDGYGDYIRHFLIGMAAVPEWAPAEGHVLRSTSIVRDVRYRPRLVSYGTFDAAATEIVRLKGRPLDVRVGDFPVRERQDLAEEGYTLRPVAGGGFVLTVKHNHPGRITIRSAE